jgi:hypothetical protein
MNREYQDYLNSPSWIMIRDTIMQSKPLCQRCGARPANHIHHLIYRRNLAEVQVKSDLIPVCKTCHNLIHRAIKLKLIPNPSKVFPKNLKNARKMTIKVSAERLKRKQSYLQTKQFIPEDLIKSIHMSQPYVQQRIRGILKILSLENVDQLKITGAAIDKIKRLITLSKDIDDSFLRKMDKHRKRYSPHNIYKTKRY